jgi:hypothetical protein
VDNVVICRLRGGLGNQLFEYAAARRIALINHAQLVLDTETGFKRDIKYHRNFELAPFSIISRPANRSEMLQPFPSLNKKWLNYQDRNKSIEFKKFIRQEREGFDPRILNLKVSGRLWLEGVWASENYFIDVAEKIEQDLQMNDLSAVTKTKIYQKIIQEKLIALHVRFFSVHSPSSNEELPISYYREAMEVFRHRYGVVSFAVFSDNPNLAKSYFNGLPGNYYYASDYLPDSSPAEELSLMSLCSGIIAANSTFSWWGGWLGERRGMNAANIIVPDPKKYSHRHWLIEGLLPGRWTKI